MSDDPTTPVTPPALAPAPDRYRLSVAERIVLYNVMSRYYGREKKGGLEATKIMDRLYDLLVIEEADEYMRVDAVEQSNVRLRAQRDARDYLEGKLAAPPAPPARRTVADAWGVEDDYRLPPKVVAAIQTAIAAEPEPGDVGWRQFASLARRFSVTKPDPTLE